MSNITLDEMLPLLRREASIRCGKLLAIFTVVSLAALVVAFFWEKKYTSMVQLYVDDSRIVAPIIGAESTLTRDQANVAREELFSNEIMSRILTDVPGQLEPGMSAVERAEIRNDIIDSTEVNNIDNQLIEIEYRDSDPKRAFETASLYAELFLAKTMRSSAAESSDAFDFILDQVETYRNKLEDAEARLESFRSQYPGVSNSTDGNVEQRIIELRRELEQSQLQFSASDQRRKSLQRELNSESSTLANDYQANETRSRIADLQGRINSLRLNYTDDYPDIVRLKQQIDDMKQIAIDQQQAATASAGAPGTTTFNLGNTTYAGAANLSPVYQQLRSDLALTSAEADSLQSRMNQLNVLLDKEVGRSTQASKVERQMAKLSRDYQINKELYEDLLRRQESARLSMSLGAEQQGVLYRIAEAANYPILPTGLRFAHIAVAGLLAAIALPFFYLFVFLKLDPRIRTASAVTEVMELPLLTTVPHLAHSSERRAFFSRPPVVATFVATVLLTYLAVSVIKFMFDSAPPVGV